MMKKYQRPSSPSKATPLRRPQSNMNLRSIPAPSPSFRMSTPLNNSRSSPIRSRPGSAMSFRPQTPLSHYSNNSNNVNSYKGTISVSIRAKPPSDNIEKNNQSWEINETLNTITNQDLGEFSFDNVFSPLINNKSVYDKCVSNIITNVMDGFNGTVFAYGMTGSGKTYSMQGIENDPGLIPLAINEIFYRIATTSSKTFKINVSYLEIYNERIIDLLGENLNQELKIRDDPIHGVKILGIHEEAVDSPQQLINILKKGDLSRKTGETDFNHRSSRSHAVVLIRINSINHSNNLETDSTLSLCDLAGSERAVTQHERRKEGSFINKSLLALSTVISRLSSNNPNNGHIPYRDSKLTRLLQPALSGDSLISILCTIHLGQQSIAETSNTLRFAARAKNVILNVSKKEMGIDDKKIINNLNNIIQKQKLEIELLKKNGYSNGSGISDAGDMSELTLLKSENRILNERLEHLTRLTDLQRTEEIIVKNDLLNIITSKVKDFSIIESFENFFMKNQYEVNEFKSYISHLENQLKAEIAANSHSHSSSNTNSPSNGNNNNKELNALVRDQEEEIMSMKELLNDKDRIIKGLKSAQRLRESLIPNQLNKLDLKHDNYDSKTEVNRLSASVERVELHNGSTSNFNDFEEKENEMLA